VNAGDTSQTERGEAGPAAMGRYLGSLVLGGLLTLALMAAVVAVLKSRGTLPPPQFSNSLCLDEKLAFMRDHPPRDPELLVVGSSVAWRHFNSPEAVRLNPEVRPYNAGLCGANLAQTREVTRWLLGRLPHVRQVILIASPVDFGGCSESATSEFDVKVADQYIFQNAQAYRFYFDYFDPVTLLKNANGLRHRRTDPTTFKSLVINDFGDGPLEPRAARELLYGAPQFDPECFKALRDTALEFAALKTSFIVALTPLHPEWKTRFDRGGRVTAQWRELAAAALAGTPGTLVAPVRDYPEDAFFDAIHLRWSHTPQFTRSLINHEQGQAASIQ
jgi:hypothetical protein